MTTLRTTLARLANDFATSVLEAIRGASLEDILAESTPERGRRGRGAGGGGAAATDRIAPARRGKGGRLGRRSPDDIAALVGHIVELLEKHPDGLRAEQIRDSLGLEAKELPRPLAEALDQRRISKQGQKRATTYFARSAGPGRKPGGKKGQAKRATKGGAERAHAGAVTALQ